MRVSFKPGPISWIGSFRPRTQRTIKGHMHIEVP